MTKTPLTEAQFLALLDEKGIKLEGAALQTALQGARHLQDQVAHLDAYLAKTEAPTST